MKVSFVIVTYNRGEALQRCLNSIFMQQGLAEPFEVILVDNGGDAVFTTPDNPNIHVRVERPAENLGAAGGREHGRALASGAYLVYLDDDAAWHQADDVARLIGIMERDPRCGAVCSRTVNPRTGETIIPELPHPNKRFLLSAKEPLEVPYFYSSCVLRRAALDAAGHYPARFFVYMEEVDLSYRLIDAGYRILFDPTPAAIHYRPNTGQSGRSSTYWTASALNKARLAFRLLPYPYPVTTLVMWSLWILVKTKNPAVMFGVWRDLWRERDLLRNERKPIRAETVRYLRRIGGRLWY